MQVRVFLERGSVSILLVAGPSTQEWAFDLIPHPVVLYPWFTYDCPALLLVHERMLQMSTRASRATLS